ncbi:hypothetical protein DB346_02545 [Verrucomicrobia bacterium LW23]|nr:hypothetical protein DB346_04110 [Verrucomicrobia bacterium LW23]PTY04327.1 hypothetical protein DB346_02545 [Verrucomicrobia bacterium LW23]
MADNQDTPPSDSAPRPPALTPATVRTPSPAAEPGISAESHDIIILHLIYGMLTGWIPVPIVDGLAADYLRRRMVYQLAAGHGEKLSSEQVHILTEERGSCLGCVGGCLFALISIPFRLVTLLARALQVLRIKRFVESAGRAYHTARLIEYALRTKKLHPAGAPAALRVRAAMDRVVATTNTTPVNKALLSILQGNKDMLRTAAAYFNRALRALPFRKRDADHVGDALQQAEAQTATSVGGIVWPLRSALDAIPPQHFTEMEAALDAELARDDKPL